MKTKEQNLEFRKVSHNSLDYWQLVELRDAVLRKPLNLAFTKDELLLEKDQLHFAVNKNQKLVGCLVFVICSTNRLKMRQVAVDSQYQNLGLGSFMIKQSEKWALENGYHEIELHARVASVKFYENLDYHITGNQFQEVGIAHYKMVKML